jgi:hypothetical protein
MGLTCHMRALFTWIRRIRGQVRVACCCTSVWILFWAIPFTAAVLFPGPFREELKPDTGKPPASIWQTDLRTEGYAEFARKGDVPSYPRFEPLCFSGNGTLIASFVVRELTDSLAKRDTSVPSSPVHLHGVFFEGATGRIRTTRDWPVAHPNVGIICAPGGKFIMATGERLTLYSPDLESLKELSTAAGSNWNPYFEFRQSPSTKSALLVYGNTAPLRRDIDAAHIREYISSIKWLYWWIDIDDLALRRSWIDGIESHISVSDEAIVTTGGSPEPGSFADLIGEPNGPKRAICRGRTCGYPQFINARAVALVRPESLRVMGTAGELLFDQEFQNGDALLVYEPLYTSADGQRFAIRVWTVKGSNALLDIGGHAVLRRVTVFDVPSRRWIYTLDAKQQKIKTISGLALSPDGSLLAIMTDGIVRVYPLPERQEMPQTQ